MKNARKLIPALAMLLVSAILMTTASFAWFSMNTTVTATGMQVQAKSSAVFLKIKGTGGTVTTGTITGAADFATSSAVAMTGVKIFPAAHETLGSLSAIAEAANWYYGYAATSDSHVLVASTKEVVAAANYGSYIAKVTYDVKIDEVTDGPTQAYDLYVKSITLPANTGISAIVAGTDGFEEFTASAADRGTGVALMNTVGTTAKTVTVYLYIDGNNAAVKTDNIAALTGSVSIVFGCFAEDTIGVS